MCLTVPHFLILQTEPFPAGQLSGGRETFAGLAATKVDLTEKKQTILSVIINKFIFQAKVSASLSPD